ncbi:tryptophan synthase alpha chain [Thiogranum longum]|uniref:Tryptophan synthase alpha chain n=1 Tax=Thiogranum longum TaxID=1537524 RepID=A0A4R1H7H7_9GAMM|nr:tryptophan synthase subunit alpha [Thiogranum longum]TCK17777.1 tryptophan synthase alpha chain [Thiogranum longum]
MSRIPARFDTLRSKGRKALIPYITAGDPQPDVTVPLMHALVKAGADLLELGVPFSDPMADGPVIQAACERALKHHISLHHVLEMVREFRQTDSETPVILMGYLNPIEVMGYETFAKAAESAGVDGALTVDLPPEEGCELVAALKTHGIDTIFLAAPTSSDERIRLMAKNGGGFLYYVSFKGVTGANRLDVQSVKNKLDQIRANTDLPVGVGFGIRDAESAAQVAGVADAVVVGSALVNRIAALVDEPARIVAEAPQVIAEMRAAMDAS